MTDGDEGEGEEGDDDDDEAFGGPDDDDALDEELGEEGDEDDELVPLATEPNLSASATVREFVWYGGKDIRSPDVQVPCCLSLRLLMRLIGPNVTCLHRFVRDAAPQSALFDVEGVPLDPFHVLLAADRPRRLATLLLAMECRDMHIRPMQASAVPEVLLLVATALRFLVRALEPSELQAFEVDALIATAISQATRSPNYKGKPTARGLPLHSATVHLSSVFLRTMACAQFLNDVR